jgi:hypothetical protein
VGEFKAWFKIQPGQPVEVERRVEAADAIPPSPLSEAMAQTLMAYVRAGHELVSGAYASARECAPPNFRMPCHVLVVCCPDGVLVRYDAAGSEEPRTRYGDSADSLTAIALGFSEQFVHVTDEPASYVPEVPLPSIDLLSIRPGGVPEFEVIAQFSIMLVAPKTLPPDFRFPKPPERPPRLAAPNQELDMRLGGELIDENRPAGAISPSPLKFVAHAVIPFPFGWLALEL